MTVKAAATLRKSKDPERMRAALMQGALEEFAALGYAGSTLRDLASRIGVTHGMIRYHYRSKEHLWYAAVDYLFKCLQEEVQAGFTREELQRLEAGDTDIFRRWLRQYVYYCAKHPEHARIMMQASVAPSERLSTVVNKHVKQGHVMGKRTIKSLQAQGIFPEDAPPESIIYIITGACQNIFALAEEPKLSLGYNALSKKAIDAHADAVIAILCPPSDAR